MQPASQTAAFVDFILSHVSQIDLAAAIYGDDGRVQKVLKAKGVIANMNDFAAVAPWLRSQNVRQPANIWIRPAVPEHAIVMLDDLPPARAVAVCRKYAGAAVETSPCNSQVWILCARALTREERQDVARSLCRLIGSDPGAISEPRWGRLPGFQQRKPGKSGWTNLLTISTDPALDPTPHLSPAPAAARPGGGGGGFTSTITGGAGGDQSVREFAFACHALRRGMSPTEIEAAIAAHVSASGRRKSRDYAARTVSAALARLR